MHLVFDIDNTILVTTDSSRVDNRFRVFTTYPNYRSMIRPGILDFFYLCHRKGHDISLWTRGSSEYAHIVAAYFQIMIHGSRFKYVLSRDDCVIMGPDNVIKKPMSKIGGDIIFDDNYENYVPGDNFVTVPYFDVKDIDDDFFIRLTRMLAPIDEWTIYDILDKTNGIH